MVDTPKTRILYVHHRSELGGAPTSLSHLIRHLDRERFDPYVYCPEGPAANLFRESGAVVYTGTVASFTHIWASTYRGRRWLLFIRELGRLPWHALRFRSIVRRGGFGLVHLNDSPMLAAAWLAQRACIPVVWHLRSALPHDGRDRISQIVRRAILRLGDAAIAINSDVADVWRVPARIVPNSVELDRFRPGEGDAARSRLGLSPNGIVVAYFGFLYPSKGFREFIQAAALLQKQGTKASYLIVGSGVRGDLFFRTPVGRLLRLFDLARNYEAEARQLVEELGLGDSVRFVPFTRETDEIYRAVDIVVAPSQGPEIGRPMLEGASSGIAVIGTGSRTGGGILEPGETTVLVEEFHATALAEAIADLVVNDDKREAMGRAARTHAMQVFDADLNARAVEELYDRLLPPVGVTRVLLVHHRSQLGGAPSSLAELIKNLDRTRFDPHVYAPPGEAARLFHEAGAIVHTGPVAIFAHAWDNPYAGFRWLVVGREAAKLVPHIRALRGLMKRSHFSIVHLNDSPLLPAAWVAKRGGAKVVWHLRSALFGDGRDRRSRMICRLIDRWGDAAIAIDGDVAARFPLRHPITVVHNSVPRAQPVRDSAEAKRALQLPADRVTIGYAGFVRRQKGWPELIHATRLLVEEGLPAHVVVIGGGIRPPAYFRTLRGRLLALTHVLTDEETAIAQLVQELGLVDHVSFLPFRTSVREVYDALDIVTFPNPGVGLGRPVLEAAAYGKPVVASGSADGAGLLLPEETGILLPRADPAAIAAALRRLIVDPELRARLGVAAAQHARANFDARVNAGRVEDVYVSLTGNPTPVAHHAEETRPEPTASAKA
jgi:glycosyltransferase involved in cell wall biosynthesis